MTKVPCTNDTQLWEGLYYPVSAHTQDDALLLLHTLLLLLPVLQLLHAYVPDQSLSIAQWAAHI